MIRSFRDWLSEGEQIYTEAMKEFESIRAQIDELEERMNQKKAEVNQIAQMIGKPPVEAPKRVAAQLVENAPPPAGAIGSVTRALTGRSMVAREVVPR